MRSFAQLGKQARDNNVFSPVLHDPPAPVDGGEKGKGRGGCQGEGSTWDLEAAGQGKRARAEVACGIKASPVQRLTRLASSPYR